MKHQFSSSNACAVETLGIVDFCPPRPKSEVVEFSTAAVVSQATPQPQAQDEPLIEVPHGNLVVVGVVLVSAMITLFGIGWGIYRCLQ